MNNALTYSIFQKPISLIKFPKISLKIFWIFSFVSILAFLVFYIFQVNILVSEISLIQSYEKKLADLLRENETLTINSAQVNSLDNLEQLIQQFGFEKVRKIHYIKISEEIVTK